MKQICWALLFSIVVVLGACADARRWHFASPDGGGDLKVGSSTAEVAGLLGSPNLVTAAPGGGEVWTYNSVRSGIAGIAPGAQLAVTLTPQGLVSGLREEPLPHASSESPRGQLVPVEKIESFAQCVRAGFPMLKTNPAQCIAPDGTRFIDTSRGEVAAAVKDAAGEPACRDQCGNGVCEQIVCMAIGCPCAESAASCPVDCSIDD